MYYNVYGTFSLMVGLDLGTSDLDPNTGNWIIICFGCYGYKLVQGRIQDFHLGGGGAQKIMCPHVHY